MADALKTFREGEDILASETNENNQFLLSKLSDNAVQVQQYVEGEVATIKSNVASVQATLQNNIDTVNEALNLIKSSIFTAIAPDYSKPKTLSSGNTMSADGWVNWNGGTAGDGSTVQLYVNGVGIGYHSYYKYGDKYNTMFFVNKGDVITFSSGTSTTFYPCKGFGEAE